MPYYGIVKEVPIKDALSFRFGWFKFAFGGSGLAFNLSLKSSTRAL